MTKCVVNVCKCPGSSLHYDGRMSRRNDGFFQKNVFRIGRPAMTPVTDYKYLDRKNRFLHYPDEQRYQEICPVHMGEGCVCFSVRHPRLAKGHVGFHQGDSRRLSHRGPTNHTLYKPNGPGVPEETQLCYTGFTRDRADHLVIKNTTHFHTSYVGLSCTCRTIILLRTRWTMRFITQTCRTSDEIPLSQKVGMCF